MSNEKINGEMVPGEFDLSIFDTKTLANEGIELEIMKPDGESSGLFIRVLGADSDSYAKIREQQERARIKALSKGGRAAIDKLYDTSKDNEMDLVLAATLSWRHVSGEALPFDIAKDTKRAREFYLAYPQVYQQVRIGINDPLNFTKASAKS